MSQNDPNATSSPPPSTPSPSPEPPEIRPPVPRGVVMSGIVVLSGFICYQGPNLWTEWLALQQERTNSQHSVVVGYPAISPDPSFAQAPEQWYREEGDVALLWARWEKGEGHHWYQIGAGEIDPTQLRGPIGQDVVRAIDKAIVETRGGTYWNRIPDVHRIAVWQIGEQISGCPLRVLQKVEVVNDLIDDRPYLVVFTPFDRSGESMNVYEADLDGRRLTMGLSGYFIQRKALLYDRGTRSLWAQESERLVALAGPLKGASLSRIAQPHSIDWKDWKYQHPNGRLIVGADRSDGIPGF